MSLRSAIDAASPPDTLRFPARRRTCGAAVPASLRRLGYLGLIVLALALPFELTQRPIVQTGFVVITNLKLILYAEVALAAISLLWVLTQSMRLPLSHVRAELGNLLPEAVGTVAPSLSASGASRRRTGTEPQSLPVMVADDSGVVHVWGRGQGGATLLFVALLIICIISSLLGIHPRDGLKWTLDLLAGGLLWLAVPLWLSDDPERKADHIVRAIVLGAVIAGLVGLVEVSLGQRFAEGLSWFKAKPSMAGPYLRLSGTFEYANIAALYFELALAFAVAGLVTGLSEARVRWSAGWAAGIVVLLAALLLTYSRGALLGLAVAAVAMLVATRRSHPLGGIRRHWRWTLGIAAGVTVIVGTIALSTSTPALLRLTTQSDQEWYRAAYAGAFPSSIIQAAPEGWPAGRVLTVPVRVTNRGPLTWSSAGTFRYDLSYHWLYPSRRVALFSGMRSPLPSNVPPGATETVVARVRAPTRPGRYLLVWDMVQEGVAWFSLKSGQYTTVPVRVLGPPVRTALVDHGPAVLPTSPPEPSRGQLWSVAARMIAARPLFGVGPDGYRLSYGAFTRPRLSHWDTRIFANSLPLEMLADLGLVGGGLYLAFLAAVAWPFLPALYRGVDAPLQIGLIGAGAAFLGHGVVDYILGSHAIFVLSWLLCGLIAASLTAHPAVDAGERRGGPGAP